MFNQKVTIEMNNTNQINSSSIKTKLAILSTTLLMFLFLAIYPNAIKAANNNPDEPSVKLSFTPSAIKMIAGQKAKVKINIDRNNYDDPVHILTGELPDGFEVQFEENPVEGDTATAWIYSPVNAIGCENAIEFSSEPEATAEPKAKLKVMVNCGIEWVSQRGSTQNDVFHTATSKRSDIAIDSNGYIYFVGNTYGVVDWGTTNKGDSDVWIAKYLSDGNRLWIRQIGTTREDQVSSVAAYSEGVYIGGYNKTLEVPSIDLSASPPIPLPFGSQVEREKAFVQKYETDGTRSWRHTGLTHYYISSGNNDVQVSTNPVFVGFNYVLNDLEPSRETMFVRVKEYRHDSGQIYFYYNTNQDNYWGEYQLVEFSKRPRSIITDIGSKSGFRKAVGYYINSNGTKSEYLAFNTWQRGIGWEFFGSRNDYDREATRVLEEDPFIAYVAGKEENRAWIAKYDIRNRTQIWHKYIDSKENDTINDLKLNRDGDIIVAGSTTGVIGVRNGGGKDAWVARFNGISGEMLWVEQFPVTRDDSFESLAVDDNNGIYLLGSTYDWQSNIGLSDALFMKFNDPAANYAFLPKIMGLSPVSANPGQEITINGKNFINVTAVHFNGEPARIVSYTGTEIRVIVPLNVTEGKVTVSTDCLTVRSPYDFTIGNPS